MRCRVLSFKSLIRLNDELFAVKSAYLLLFLIAFAGFAACAPQSTPAVFSATLPALAVTAPLYTNTPLYTATPLPTATPISTATPLPTDPPIPSATLIPTDTLMPTQTLPSSATPSPVGTQPLFTLTPASNAGAPPAVDPGDAPLSVNSGWSCDDFPCEDDIAGWLQRIQVPAGFHVEHVGRFPGQPMQITYGPDGRLYATVLENGTRNGAVYVMDSRRHDDPLQRRFRSRRSAWRFSREPTNCTSARA